jgi:hypothetical protein
MVPDGRPRVSRDGPGPAPAVTTTAWPGRRPGGPPRGLPELPLAQRRAREAKMDQDQVVEIPGVRVRETGDSRRAKADRQGFPASGRSRASEPDIWIHDMFPSREPQLGQSPRIDRKGTSGQAAFAAYVPRAKDCSARRRRAAPRARFAVREPASPGCRRAGRCNPQCRARLPQRDDRRAVEHGRFRQGDHARATHPLPAGPPTPPTMRARRWI